MTRAMNEGQIAATTEDRLSQATLRRLRTDEDFWIGFNFARSTATHIGTVIEDPTCPGGWRGTCPHI